MKGLSESFVDIHRIHSPETFRQNVVNDVNNDMSSAIPLTPLPTTVAPNSHHGMPVSIQPRLRK